MQISKPHMCTNRRSSPARHQGVLKHRTLSLSQPHDRASGYHHVERADARVTCITLTGHRREGGKVRGRCLACVA